MHICNLCFHFNCNTSIFLRCHKLFERVVFKSSPISMSIPWLPMLSPVLNI